MQDGAFEDAVTGRGRVLSRRVQLPEVGGIGVVVDAQEVVLAVDPAVPIAGFLIRGDRALVVRQRRGFAVADDLGQAAERLFDHARLERRVAAFEDRQRLQQRGLRRGILRSASGDASQAQNAARFPQLVVLLPREIDERLKSGGRVVPFGLNERLLSDGQQRLEFRGGGILAGGRGVLCRRPIGRTHDERDDERRDGRVDRAGPGHVCSRYFIFDAAAHARAA